MLYKKSVITTTTDFQTVPEQVRFNSNGTANISCTGYGLIAGASGLRWWDNNVLNANTTINGVSGQILTFPFTKSFLPNYYYDLIAKVQVNNQVAYYATSNSPDNIVVNTPDTNGKLFYLDLRSFKLNNELPYYPNQISVNNVNNHFMMGGDGYQAETIEPVYARFSEPTSVAGSLTVNLTHQFYGSAPTTANFTKTVNYLAGVSEVAVFTPKEIVTYFYAGYGLITYTAPAKYTIAVTCSDNSYKSIFNFYHHGIAG